MVSPTKLRFILMVTVLTVTGVSLIGWAMRGSMVYYYPVREIAAEPGSSKFQNVRLSGLVKPGSIERHSDSKTISFLAMDKEDKNVTVKVVHNSLEVPDMFKDHAEVIAEGSITPQGTFESTFMMAKCPSKYEAQYKATGASPHEAGYNPGSSEGKPSETSY